MVPNALMTLVTVLGLGLVLLVVATVAGVSVAVLSSGLLCPGLLTVVSRAGTVLLSSSCPGVLTAVSRIGTELLCPGLLAVGVSRIGTEPTTLGVSTSGGGGWGRASRWRRTFALFITVCRRGVQAYQYVGQVL